MSARPYNRFAEKKEDIIDEVEHNNTRALFRLGLGIIIGTVVLSFVFDNYCPIMT